MSSPRAVAKAIERAEGGGLTIGCPNGCHHPALNGVQIALTTCPQRDPNAGPMD